MEKVSVSKSSLESIIGDLESAIRVCHNVDYGADCNDSKDIEKTSAYATGYSRATMQQIVSDLKNILN